MAKCHCAEVNTTKFTRAGRPEMSEQFDKDLVDAMRDTLLRIVRGRNGGPIKVQIELSMLEKEDFHVTGKWQKVTFKSLIRIVQ